MQRIIRSALIVVFALLSPVLATVSAQAEIMYAVTDGCLSTCVPVTNGLGRLLVIDTTTKAQTVISDDLGTGPLEALATMPSGLMYSITTTGLLIAIDPLTGTASYTGTQIHASNRIESLAANANGDLYGVTVNSNAETQLYKINPATGATLIGNMGLGIVAALDFSPQGILYAGIGGRLATINTTTGVASLLPGASPNCCYTGIAFDSNGVLWGMQKGATSGQLYTIDPTTGVSTVFADTGLDGTITGIEFLQPVPVPAAVWLFGSGLAAMAGWARRKC